MADLSNTKLVDLLPASISGDANVIAAASAIDGELQKVTALIPETVLIARIDVLPEKVLDLLAWQWHVDFYDPVGFSIEKKRAVIKNSSAWHRKKGTPWAVKHSLLSAGLERVDITERIPGAHWAQFDVQIDVLEQPLPSNAISSAFDLIHAYKAARSHLRNLIVALNPKLTRHIRTFCLEQTHLVIYPRVRTHMTAHTAKATKPLAVIETQIIEVYPQ